jgi:hypothetical protein
MRPAPKKVVGEQDLLRDQALFDPPPGFER